MKNQTYQKFFKGKVVLVTGGTGSIGSEIVREVLKYPVKQVRILSRDEYKQFILQQEFHHLPHGRVSFLIGDIRDRKRVALAMENVDLVYSAAAMKHVSLCENNPFEAVKTNVLGIQNLVEEARLNNVKKFTHISTDKAAQPVNVMGATKLLSEKIVTSAENYKGNHKTIFSVVRFGNVFGSRGSVVPIFTEQIKKGGPVTLTDENMTRFMMRIPEAAGLVLKASYLSRGGELFILKMPVLKIKDLAEAMIEVLAPKFNYKKEDIKIKIIGKKNGEKIYELLMIDEEPNKIFENHKMYCLAKKEINGFKKTKTRYCRSDESELLSREQLKKILEDYYYNDKC